MAPLEFAFAFGGGPQDLTITMSGAVDALGLKRVDDALAADPQFRPGLAIVASDADTFAKTVHYRAHLGGSASRRRVFTNRDEALAWLRETDS